MTSAIKALVTEARWRGLWGTVRAIKMNKMGTMQCFVGEDKFHNRFFENKEEWYGRDRWVEYVDDRNVDSLKITPEWHAWLHHNTDEAPSKAPLAKPTYQTEFSGNATGTREAYVPAHHKLAKGYRGNASEKFETWRPGVSDGGVGDSSEKDVLDLK